MKLAQSILISLSILICFSPTLSLAMQEHRIDIHDANNRDELVIRLKNRNINLFENDNITLKNLLRLKYELRDRFYWYIILATSIIFFSLLSGNFSNNTKIAFISLGTLFGVLTIITCIFKMRWICCVSKDHLCSFLWCSGENQFNDFFSKHNKDTIREYAKFVRFFGNPDKCLFVAILKEFPNDIIEFLINEGGKLNVEDFNKVIQDTSFEMVKFLVDIGIDINAKDENGRPAIIKAIACKKFQIIELLDSNEVNFDVVDSAGKSASEYLCEFSNEEKSFIQNTINKLRKEISDQIYKNLEEVNFPRVHADMISEYLV